MTISRSTITQVSLVQSLEQTDASELRAQEWQAYQKQSKKLERSSQLLKAFQSAEMPEYQGWIESNFGTTLGQCRQVIVQIKQTEDFLDQVHTYSSLLGISKSSAFRILSEARQNGTLHEVWQKLQEEQFKEKRQNPRFEDSEDSFASTIHGLFDGAEETNHNNDGAGRHTYHGDEDISDIAASQHRNSKCCSQSLKTVYHKLARKLHPDFNTNPSDEHKALFQTVQSFYKFGDVEALEEIWLKFQSGAEQSFDWKTAAIAEIINRRRSVEKRLKRTIVGLKSAKLHPAWGFHKIHKNSVLLSKFGRQTRSQLESDLKSASHHLGLIKKQLKNLEAKSQKNTTLKNVKIRK